MKNTHQSYRSSGSLFVRTSKVMLGIFALALVSSASQVEAQSSVRYELGESSRVLRASLDLQRGNISQAEFNAIRMTETCKSPSSRLHDRNRPWIMVWNTSTSSEEIDTVSIDLKEPGFEFGDGDLPGDGFDGMLSLLSNRSDGGVSLTSKSYGSDNSELVLNFSGLSNDLAAIFRIDIDEPGGIAMFPDFRAALMGADTGGGPGQRATLTTNYSSGASDISRFGQAGALSTSGVAEAYHAQSLSPIEPSTTVPEPTTLALMLAALAATAVLRRKK